MDSDFEIKFSETNYTHHWKNMFKKVNDQIFQKLATRSKIGFTVMVKINLRVSILIYRGLRYIIRMCCSELYQRCYKTCFRRICRKKNKFGRSSCTSASSCDRTRKQTVQPQQTHWHPQLLSKGTHFLHLHWSFTDSKAILAVQKRVLRPFRHKFFSKFKLQPTVIFVNVLFLSGWYKNCVLDCWWMWSKASRI